MSFTLTLLAILYFSSKPLFHRPVAVKDKSIENHDRSIVVLPFNNLDNDPDNQYFTDGIWIDILNRLCGIRDLRVISRTTSEYFRGSKLTAREIGSKINVNYILEGDVRRYGGNVWLAVRLVGIENDRNIWSDQYDMPITDIFRIQFTIAEKIASELRLVFSGQETGHVEEFPTHDPEAYNLCLLGRYFDERRTKEGMEKSIAYYTKATEIDPDYAQAYTGLAYVYFHYTWENFCSRTAGFEKVRESALRALEIDKNQAEALTILANLSCMDWKWEKARKEFMHAIECNPNVELAHRYYSFLLEMLGEQEEARRQIDLARKIDPLSLSVLWNSSASYYYSGEYEKALEELRIYRRSIHHSG